MNDPRDPDSLAARLLRQDDPVSAARYQEYRAKLEAALTAARWRERLAGRVVVIACVLSLALMFVGGGGVIGSFDPWSKDATLVSVAAGVVYCVATGVFFLSLASYFSRFRPGVSEARERLRDADLLELQQQIRELREGVKDLTPQPPLRSGEGETPE
jgi:hypothetical protein